MSSMWNVVSLVQKGLDEAAGISTSASAAPPPPPASTSPVEATSDRRSVSVDGAAETEMVAAFSPSSQPAPSDVSEDEHSRPESIVSATQSATSPAAELHGTREKIDERESQMEEVEVADVVEVSDAAESDHPTPAAVEMVEERDAAPPEPIETHQQSQKPIGDTEQLTEALVERTRELEHAMDSLRHARGELERSQQQAEALRGQLKEANKEGTRTQGKLKQLAAENASLLRQNEQLESSNKEVQRKYEDAVRSSANSSQLIEEGQALSEKLGKERERTKTLHQEKKNLETKVESLMKELQSFEVKERNWESSKEVFEANESAHKETLASLQQQVATYSRELTQATQQLTASEEKYGQLSEAMEEMRATGDTALMSFDDERHALQQAHRDEVDKLRAYMRSTIADYDRRMSALESELSQMSSRANAAEAKGIETSRSITEATQLLQRQLQQVESEVRPLKEKLHAKDAELVKVRAANATLHEAVASMERDLRESASSQIREISDMESNIRQLAQENESLTATAQSLRKKLASITEASERSAALRATEIRRHEEMVQALEKTLQEQRARSSTHASPAAVAGAAAGDAKHARARPSASMEGSTSSYPEMDNPTDSSGPSRVDREIVRLSLEVQSLKQHCADYDDVVNQLKTLSQQHDTLLQMFGQQEEELLFLREEATDLPSSYKSQIEMLGQEIDRLSRK